MNTVQRSNDPQGEYAYDRAWDAIGELLARGRSWSGRERNCCFLNLRDGSFASVGATFDIDTLDDSRAVATTDWDLDGDLDLWISNRTDPRIRLLENPFGQDTRSIAFKLVGVDCNRDAIGAKIEIDSSERPSSIKSIREVKAGDGYLSQSSKWVHFGLGTADRAVDLKVYWPNGTIDTHSNLKPSARYIVTQGGTVERQADYGNQPKLADDIRPLHDSNADSLIRLIPQTPLPLPSLPATKVDDGGVIDIARSTKPTLVIFWADWCKPCVSELKQLSSARQEFRQAGVNLLAVNVGDTDHDLDEQRRIAQAEFRRTVHSITAATGSRELMETVDVVVRTLTSIHEPLTLPSSILVDSEGRLIAVYKGGVSSRRVLSDASALSTGHTEKQPEDVRNLAVPFAGRWFTNPAPADLLAIPMKLVRLERTPAAFEYLERHVKPLWLDDDKNGIADTKVKELLSSQVSQAYFEVAIGFAEGKGTTRDLAATENALKFAILVTPDHWDSLGTLGSLYSQSGRDQLAVRVFKRMLRLRSNELGIANNLAWILATTSDDSLFDPVTSLALAKKVCERSDFAIPSAIDTLSVAHAANAEFNLAIEFAQLALTMMEATEDAAAVRGLRERIDLFRNRQPYRR